jgi:hypothetical protein
MDTVLLFCKLITDYVRLVCLVYVFDDMVVIVIALMCKVTYLNTRELLF